MTTPDPVRPLAGRAALVTGASRSRGIGFAVAERLARLGADVYLHGHPPGDSEQAWGAEAGGTAGRAADLRERLGSEAADLRERLGSEAAPRIAFGELDLGDAEAPARLVDQALAALGRLDILVATHTHWKGQTLAQLEAAELDRHLTVIVRGSLLLAQALAARRPAGPGGRVVLFLTGQHRGAMPGEIAYVAAKGALHQATPSLADELAERGITVNAVNPGPTDTGWAAPDGAFYEAIRRRQPTGRWATPEDAARLVGWLCSDEAEWITGQVIDSEGGFRRHQWETGGET